LSRVRLLVSLRVMNWTVDHARTLYNLSRWSEGYVDVSPRGTLLLRPHPDDDGPGVDLTEVARAVHDSGLGWPVLVRCSAILKDRVARLHIAFGQARARHGYEPGYTTVYPIKVNQQFSVVSKIAGADAGTVGLEAGSKPELMAVLGLSQPGGMVICNGYKDREYIRIGLIGRRLGQRLYLVIEKLSELEQVIEQAGDMGIPPLLGVRVRMASIGAGNWQNTGGEKSKFGLQAAQVLRLIDRLREAGLLECLRLLHFHLGSQLANIDDIRRGVREAARFYTELRALGVPLDVMDVGGGLAVDYEGTRSRHYCSMNYSVQEYADAVVGGIAGICRETGTPEPELVTESGRAMTAHHAFLITNVIDVESADGEPAAPAPGAEAPAELRELFGLTESGAADSAIEVYHTARGLMEKLIAAYGEGRIGIAQRAAAETWYTRTCLALRDRLQPRLRDQRELLETLNERLADKYFLNFSVFQSLPDVWAIDQIFPIVPLQRLDEEPHRRAILEDLTCDSDGHIEYYVDGEGIEKSLPLHAVDNDPDYLLGIFMVGAYQEILGDMHNLFGDTNAVDLDIGPDGTFTLSHAEHGDRVDELLRIVHFDPHRLRAVYRQRTRQAGLGARESQQYLSELEAGLSGYTYLEE
jgi:arginine decarboxylase